VSVDANRVQSLFQAASAVDESAERTALLDRECGDDADLRQKVESLLRANDNLAPILRHADPDITHCIHAGRSDDEEAVLVYLTPSGQPGSLGRLGHYEVQSVLGRGGFGVVLKAFDDVLHRTVAIKMMAPSMAATSPARRRFLREARGAAAVRHENVVQVYAVEEQPIPHLVMQFVPGNTLQQILDERGPLETAGVLRIGVQVARGLAAAHETGLVHRDVKPANVLVEDGPEMRATLTDFGLARAADDASLTQSGVVAGTPLFMSPEQARGEEIDHRTDLFSLGSMLYMMASGRPPFRAATTIAVLQRVNDETPRSIRDIIPEVPQWLCDIIAKLHSKDPAERFQSAREVADVLADCEAQLRRHGKLVDRSHIPARRTAALRRSHWLAPAALAAIFALLALCEVTGISHFLGRPAFTATSEVAAADGKPTHRYTNLLGMHFALVPKGKAWLGGGGGNLGSREVDMPRDFYLGVYEVIQEEWEQVMGPENNPSRYRRGGDGDDDVAGVPDDDLRRFPVDSVSWDQCQEFVKRLNERIREPGWVYRLPTSDEWEYACRGGGGLPREQYGYDFYLDYATNELSALKANFNPAGKGKPCKVGMFPPNRLGLYDMHGNVFEYCDDRNGDADKDVRLLRGGNWVDDAKFCRAGRTGFAHRSGQYNGAGLRLARVPDGDR
jgi:serine/threonine protein kinase/formylglycine-generating enzyme required for sulfatase activity